MVFAVSKASEIYPIFDSLSQDVLQRGLPALASRAAFRLIPAWEPYHKVKDAAPDSAFPLFESAFWAIDVVRDPNDPNRKKHLEGAAKRAHQISRMAESAALKPIDAAINVSIAQQAAGLPVKSGAKLDSALYNASHAATMGKIASLVALGNRPNYWPAGGQEVEFWMALTEDLKFLSDEAIDNTPTELIRLPLWSKAAPRWVEVQWSRMRADFSPSWASWIAFYDRILAGKVESWSLPIDSNLTEPKKWAWETSERTLVSKQVSKVSSEWSNIESLSPAAQSRLTWQVENLMATAHLQEVTATALAAQIDKQITDYLAIEQTNALPEELRVIGRIGTTLRAISEKVSPARDQAGALEELKKRILELEAELKEAQTNLSKAEYRDSFDRYFEIAMESGAKWAGPAVLAGATTFVANFVDPGTLNELGASLRSYLRARA